MIEVRIENNLNIDYSKKSYRKENIIREYKECLLSFQVFSLSFLYERSMQDR